MHEIFIRLDSENDREDEFHFTLLLFERGKF
jgi:hypothetical protein